jgi:hypothetical protein
VTETLSKDLLDAAEEALQEARETWAENVVFDRELALAELEALRFAPGEIEIF